MEDKARCEQGIHRGDHVRVVQRSRALHCSTGTNTFIHIDRSFDRSVLQEN
jgi:hypothetical protein